MIKKSLLLFTLLSLSNAASAHLEVLHSSSTIEQITHLLTSPFHIATFVSVIAVLAVVTYKMRPKCKAQKIRDNDKKPKK